MREEIGFDLAQSSNSGSVSLVYVPMLVLLRLITKG
jgi:hypothetical protein